MEVKLFKHKLEKDNVLLKRFPNGELTLIQHVHVMPHDFLNNDQKYISHD